MNDAAFPRRHRREGIRQAALADPLSRYVRSQSKLLQAGGAEILAVEADLLVFVGSKTKHLERHILKGAQQLRAVLQHQRTVGAGNLHQDFGALPVAVAAELRIDGDLVAQTEVAVGEGRGQQFADLLGGRDFVMYRHKKLLGLKSLYDLSSLKGLGSTYYAYPALKRWAIIFRPALRD